MLTFDICLMNPPFSGSMHLDFLERTIDLSDKTVVVEPGQWLVQLKENSKYTKPDSVSDNIKKRIDGHVKSVELANLNKQFNIANKTVCSITAIDFTRTYNHIELECCGEKNQVKSVYDCNLIGNYETVKSILNKCKTFKDHMIDHCVNLKNIENYKDKGYWFLPYANYMINNLGSSYGKLTQKLNSAGVYGRVDTRNGAFLDSFLKVLALSLDDEFITDNIQVGIKNSNPKDSVYGTREELENWRWYAYNNKLPLFINICLTIDEHNNSREYVPWIVDRQYSDNEIYDMLRISEDEQELIDKTIKNFDINSEFGKKLYNI